jgi:hypothetical protein
MKVVEIDKKKAMQRNALKASSEILYSLKKEKGRGCG